MNKVTMSQSEGRSELSKESGTAVIANEYEELKKIVSPRNIVSLHPRVAQLSFRPSRVKNIKAQFIFLKGYPKSNLSIDLSSTVFSDGLLAKLKTACEKQILQLTGKPQLIAVVKVIIDFMGNNKLLSVWEDIRNIRKLLPDKNSLKMNASKGTIRVRLTEQKYSLSLLLSLSNSYPDDELKFKIQKSSFGESITRAFEGQLLNVVSRLHQGCTPEQAFCIGGGRKKKQKKKGDEPIVISAQHLLSCKNDVRFLQERADLRAMSEDKKMRRVLARMNKKENKKRIQEQVVKEEQENGENPVSRCSVYVYQVVLFACKHLVKESVQERCQGCEKLILPEDPSNLKEIKEDSKLFPTRSNCGHYFHSHCLKKFLTRPPFGKKCVHCKRRVQHPKYSSKVQQLEKAWAMKQARKRELLEIVDFIGDQDCCNIVEEEDE